jgi:hypothetical protein
MLCIAFFVMPTTMQRRPSISQYLYDIQQKVHFKTLCNAEFMINMAKYQNGIFNTMHLDILQHI